MSRESDQFNLLCQPKGMVPKQKYPIRSITIEIMRWEPDRLFPEGGYAADVTVIRQDENTEVHSTRMWPLESLAWKEAQSIKARLVRAG